jgi:outer membrane protein TolC
VLTHRPDILAAERRIAQAGFNVDVARKALYPSLSLSAGIGDQFAGPGDFGTDIAEIFDLKSIAYNYALQITAPIFQGGRLRAQIDVQAARLEAQLETYAETVLNAYREVENALDAEVRLAERETALRTSLSEAQLAEERLERRYIEGLATILQLLDAQTRALNAEGQLIGARAERLANRVRLNVALGGGRFGELAPVPAVETPIKLPNIDIPLIGALAPSDTTG